MDVLLVYSSDRLARKYAYQALLIEDLAKAGTTVIFVKGPRGSVDGGRAVHPCVRRRQLQGLGDSSNRALLPGPSPDWRTQFLLSRGQTKPFVGLRHADEWAFAELVVPAAGEVPGEYEDLDDLIGRFQLDNGYAALALDDPTWLAAVKSLVENYSQCAGDTCRM